MPYGQDAAAVRLARGGRLLAVVAAAVVGAIAALALVGWATGVNALVRSGLGGATMKLNTAVALGACAGAVIALSRGSVRGRRAAAVLGLVVAAVGAATLTEYLGPVDLGIDQLLIDDPLGRDGLRYPGRPSPQTGVALLLLGVALTAQTGGRRLAGAGRWLLPAAVLPAVVSVFEHASGLESLFAVPGLTEMALNTGVAILLTTVATVLVDPAGAPASAILEPGARGSTLRRVLPVVVVTRSSSGSCACSASGPGSTGRASGC